jgi:hypothetical protein
MSGPGRAQPQNRNTSATVERDPVRIQSLSSPSGNLAHLARHSPSENGASNSPASVIQPLPSLSSPDPPPSPATTTSSLDRSAQNFASKRSRVNLHQPDIYTRSEMKGEPALTSLVPATAPRKRSGSSQGDRYYDDDDSEERGSVIDDQNSKRAKWQSTTSELHTSRGDDRTQAPATSSTEGAKPKPRSTRGARACTVVRSFFAFFLSMTVIKLGADVVADSADVCVSSHFIQRRPAVIYSFL